MADLIHKPVEEPERFSESEDLKIGTWVWVYNRKPDENDEIEGWFGCVTHVGSNYVLVTEPHSERFSHKETRVHFNEIVDVLEVEPDPDRILSEYAEECKAEVRQLLNKARKLLEHLGLSDRMLPGPEAEQTTALVLASKTLDIKKHKNALIKAKEKTLPDIFKQIENANTNLVKWMSAKALPMRAMAEQTKGVVAGIEDRVFTIELYAGLLEDVKMVRKGRPAGLGEKLHIMQRRCYMDEECLLGYRTGGIDIKNLKGFDKWLSQKENFNRILPFPRCMVAFQVRRHTKEREWDGTFAGAFIKVHLEQMDKLTFLYIRNGNQLYRLNTKLEFGSTIFPDRDEHVIEEQMRGHIRHSDVEGLITERHYQDMLQELTASEKERTKNDKAWRKKHPNGEWIDNPFHDDWDSRCVHDWERDYYPYDSSSVYYDDIHEFVGDSIKQHNRIAVIVQGLFDRSKVLHPHAPVKLWTQEGFDVAVELVYDSDHVLYPSAEPPDFEAYRARCNESLGEGSVTVGQEDFWERKEAKKYNEQMHSDWRVRDHHDVKRHQPYGNPGPGFLARIGRWAPRVRKATYQWERERQTPSWKYYYGQRKGPIQCHIVVPDTKLFNVGAYKPGDFKQFFQDPRTRANYLKWAEMLLAAEEFHAGNLKVGGKP